jgi:hypothetical protein
MQQLVFIAVMSLLATGAGCGHAKRSEATQENKTMTMKDSSPFTTACADRLRALVIAGDLSLGTGLPTSCVRGDAEAALGANGDPGQGRLSGFSRSWVKYRITDDSVARVWLDEHDEIMLVDVTHPKVAESPAVLRRRLGEPAMTIPARHDPTHEEWIYPDRGITVAVGNEGDATSTAKVSYLFVYAPTTLDDYVGRLGGKDAWVVRRPQR